ncbi:MAG TPA: NAD(P)H-hydrate dehydratase, partial [Burkholderiaceae bacterium]|nr:NAD(P)H-hydrate dehydratase [Burkholderiaceae bacterium]
AARAWQQAGAAALPIEPLSAFAALPPQAPVLVIDGLFGIGLTRALPPAAEAAVELPARHDWPVIAVDVPSGLLPDTGRAAGDGAVVRAAVTVTMIGDKPGLHTGAGRDAAGQVRVATLGLALPQPDGELLGAGALDASALQRPQDSHKGRFGDLLVIGGAPGMTGAALLAALGAQAAGAGRIYVAALDPLPADPAHPELMTRKLPTGRAELGDATAIVIGCGLGRSTRAAESVAAAIAHGAALVADADALNAIAADPTLAESLRARADRDAATVLTPHPLEAARLLQATTAAVQSDRIAAALALARRYRGLVVLKGSGSVIAAPDGRWAINGSGGPALATAGSGDVLAGAIGGLLAARVPPWQATRLAVWAHGAAGDAIAERDGVLGVAAGALPAAIRDALNRLPARPAATA